MLDDAVTEPPPDSDSNNVDSTQLLVPPVARSDAPSDGESSGSESEDIDRSAIVRVRSRSTIIATRPMSLHLQILMFSNILEMINSTQGTLIWQGLFYANTDREGSAGGYVTKTPLMGFLPNLTGSFIVAAAEYIRVPEMEQKHERLQHIKLHGIDYLKIFFWIDFIYQPLQDLIHFIVSGDEWQYFSTPDFTSPAEILLNVALTLIGISAFHYWLTTKIRPNYKNSLESFSVGLSYFCFFFNNYFQQVVGNQYDIDDKTMNYAGASISTGIATFITSVSYDSYLLIKQRNTPTDEKQEKLLDAEDEEKSLIPKKKKSPLQSYSFQGAPTDSRPKVPESKHTRSYSNS